MFSLLGEIVTHLSSGVSLAIFRFRDWSLRSLEGKNAISILPWLMVEKEKPQNKIWTAPSKQKQRKNTILLVSKQIQMFTHHTIKFLPFFNFVFFLGVSNWPNNPLLLYYYAKYLPPLPNKKAHWYTQTSKV